MGAVLRLPLEVNVRGGYHGFRCYVGQTQHGVWNSMVIDYESMYTYALSEETLRQVCGPNTTFEKVTSGYGLFPPNNLRLQVNREKDIDWGITEFYKRDGSSIRGYFT